MANLGNTIINGILRVNGKLNVGGSITASSFIGDLVGNATTATTATTATNATNATTATNANQLTTARTISLTGDATASGSFNGTANLALSTTVKQMDVVEDRDIKPSVTPKGKFSTYFATKAGLTGSEDTHWLDLLVMNGWENTSGGNVNALAFDKTTKAIYHYQAGQGTTTWGTASQIAYITSNVASATKLQTARTINGTSFDGSANITTANWGTARNIGIVNSDGTGTAVATSVNGSANINLKLPATIKAALTGNASTATKLQTARTINGVSFDGSKNITIEDYTKLPLAGGTMTGTLKIQTGDAQGQLLLGEENGVGVRFIAGTQPSSAYSRFAITKDHIYASGDDLYDNAWISYNGDGDVITFDGTIVPKNDNTNTIGNSSKKWSNIYATTFTGALSGNASTATKLQTARTIGLSGVTATAQNFNGSQNIVIPITAVPASLITGTVANATTATKLGTKRTISLTGAITGSGDFDGSGNLSITTSNPITTITKTLTVTTSWQDTGITLNSLSSSGSYIVQVSGMSSSATNLWSEIFTGIMSVYAGTTNSSDSDEIILHKSGHASNGRTIYLRTLRTGNSGYVKLQIAASATFTSSSYTFKFRKLI